MVLTTTAPALVAASQQRWVIGGADQDAIAWFDAEVFNKGPGDAVRPVR